MCLILKIYLYFRVEKSRYFRRDGADVHTDASISLSQAVLGGNIRIQGVYEDQYIQIEPGTSSHHRICLKGKGLKRVNSYGSGDHYINIKIDIPKKLSAEQKTILQAYAELETDTPGQIFGVTMKSDGKPNFEKDPSNNDSYKTEKLDKKFTQGSKETEADNEKYQEHDKSDTHEYRKEQLDGKVWSAFGFLILIALGYFLTNYSSQKRFEEERDRALEEQRRIREEEFDLRNANSPFKNA